MLDVMAAMLPGITLAAGVLMVSRVKYPHIINKFLKGNRPFVMLVEIAFVVMLVAIFREPAFFLAFFAYAAMGPFLWVKKKAVRKPAGATSEGGDPTTEKTTDKTTDKTTERKKIGS